jgi:ribose transport system substrate-binding protein
MVMFQRRKVAAMAVGIALVGTLAACSSTSGSTEGGASGGGAEEDFTVGVIALDATQVTANLERAASQKKMEELGWETVEINSNGNPAEAITAMQNLVQRKVDAIVVQTYTPDQLVTGLAAAEAAGIPVFSSSGGDAGGTMAGAVELVNAAAVNDPLIELMSGMEEVELLQLRYTPGAPCLARAEDLDAKLEDLDNVTVTREEVTIPGGQQSAQEATAGWLQRNQNTTADLVIWPCFSEAALGAVVAEQQLDRGPYELYTWDISQPAVEALQAGTMSAVLWIQVEEAGTQLAELIDEWHQSDGDWEQKTVNAPSVLLTPDNIEEYLTKYPELAG